MVALRYSHGVERGLYSTNSSARQLTRQTDTNLVLDISPGDVALLHPKIHYLYEGALVSSKANATRSAV